MSPLGKAKGGLAIVIGAGKPGAGHDDEAAEGEDMSEDSTLSEIAAAIKEGDGEGAAQAIAAYVDACMARKGE